ncbi:ATP-dependent DNA helicase [Frankliniella fusca]|uniref:ATP-dependent DNA helicase n=1 Tax=Frankliniella fusca TaxID=407009 RepID=A0AAE1HHN8_9NEOP|nr:ATP-dependent DNA helicase [Frankliniella fusca]
MLLWLQNAPIYESGNRNSRRAVCKFIDSIISCSSSELSEDLRACQTHRHSHTCTKRNGSDECRFGIPYLPMKNTKILEPLSEDLSRNEKNYYNKLLEKIRSTLNSEEVMSMDFDEFLKTIDLEEKEYIQVLRSSLKNPQIFIRRDPKDILISPFSPKLISLMRSNQNIQFVLDAFGAACYVIDYINKTDKGMSNLMRDILQEVRENNESIKQGLRMISNTFHNNSELCIQEACYNILQLHMSECSEECIFIPTFPPNERVKLVKSQEKLESLEDDSTDIFEGGLLDHYVNRPNTLSLITLAEFAAQYRFSTSPTKHSLKLKRNKGYITKRTKPRVIRYRNYHYELEPDNYLREHLMLYHPWKNESKDILQQDIEKLFKEHKDSIQKVKSLFNSLQDEVMALALEEAEDREIIEDRENSLDMPVFDFDSYTLNDSLTKADIQTEFGTEIERENPIKFITPSKVPQADFQHLHEKLNTDQRDFVYHLSYHFQTSDEQILYFLTGGAGVGKSLTISVIYQTLTRILNASPDSNPDKPKVLLCAYTGKAAFNIKGQTLHSAFKLVPNQKNLNELSASVSNSLATELHHVKLIIIDEISMVSQHILDMIDKRLRHLFNPNKSFGGISILAVGDFYQLRPVFGTALYNSKCSNPYDEIFDKRLWSKFKVFRLTKIMRQDDKHFQKALNHLAKGTLTKSDVQLFKSRTYKSVPEDKELKNATHLFSRNVDVNSHNIESLQKIEGSTIECKASDIITGTGSTLARRQLLYSLENSTIQDTLGIPHTILLKVKAKYMITYNIDTEDGLCNGATGILKQIDFGTNAEGNQKPLQLWIQFDDADVGHTARKKMSCVMNHKNIPNTSTPITPVAVTVKRRKTGTLKVVRKQFPLTLAHAITIHKSQGLTLPKVVVHIKGRISRDLLYVSFSRATHINGLYIIGNFTPPSKVEKDSPLGYEVKRWKKHKVQPQFKFLRYHAVSCKQIIYHNVQSLRKHIGLVQNDEVFTKSDIILLGETWSVPTDDFAIDSFKLICHTTAEIRRPNGVSIYVKENMCHLISDYESFSISDDCGNIDAAYIIIEDTLIAAVYIKPKTKIGLWIELLKHLQLLHYKNFIFIGDVNINYLKRHKSKPFEDLLKVHNLTVQNTKTVTTHFGTLLDWTCCNSSLNTGTYVSYFSYHYPIWTSKI